MSIGNEAIASGRLGSILKHLEEIRKEVSGLAETSSKWSSKVPTVPGTYWVYSKRMAFKQIAFVMNSNLDAPFITTITGAVIKYNDMTMTLPEGVLMCGPLYEPLDPTDKDFEME